MLFSPHLNSIISNTAPVITYPSLAFLAVNLNREIITNSVMRLCLIGQSLLCRHVCFENQTNPKAHLCSIVVHVPLHNANYILIIWITRAHTHLHKLIQIAISHFQKALHIDLPTLVLFLPLSVRSPASSNPHSHTDTNTHTHICIHTL